MNAKLKAKLDWSQWADDPSTTDLDKLAAKLNALDAEADASDQWPAGLWSALVDHGVPLWSLPSEFGGNSEGCGRSLLLTRYARIAEASLTAAFILSQHDAGVRRLLAASERPVSREWLNKIAKGEAFVTVGISQLTTSKRHGDQALLAEGVEGTTGYRLVGVMPWVTAAERADLVVAGAVNSEGMQMLIALPMGRRGISVQPSFALAALQASKTAEIRCEGVEVAESDILIGPLPSVMSHPGGVGTGGLETSALALGQARAAIAALAEALPKREELTDSVDALADTWRTAWGDMMAASEERQGAPPSGKVRAEANALVLRATQAFLTARKGSGFVREESAQRWARQSLFFLVWSCPSAIAQAMIEELAGICDA